MFGRRTIAEPAAPPLLTDSQVAQRKRALDLLQAMIGSPEAAFRDDQWPVIDALVNQRDKVLLVQRTGWGKSAVYFITARLLRDAGCGPTIIVSPLVALMRNQVMAGRKMGLKIGALHAGTNDRFDTFVDLITRDQIDVLLISPERFANPQFVDRLLPLLIERLGLLVVDEAHCISDWGHDFRPDYQRLANVMRQLPSDIPLLATTATANDRVVLDIQQQLGDIGISRGRLIRENLALQGMPRLSSTERYAWLAQTVPDLPGKGIVYTITKADAERLAGWLRTRGVDAHAYHSDVQVDGYDDTLEAKKYLEDEFTNGDLRVLVATTALGMGYDNPNVRFVIHYQAPSSIIAYYQQVGRAGRGQHGAIGVLMSGPEDAGIHENFRTASLPTGTDVMTILHSLDSSGGRTAAQLMGQVNIPKGRLDAALRYLSVQDPPPITKEGTTWKRTAHPWRTDYVQRRDALIALREGEWQEMEAYRRLKQGCRMQFLLEVLDDPAPPARCGICETCRGEPLLALEIDPDILHEANRYLFETRDESITPRLQIPKGALPTYGFPSRIPAELRAEPGFFLGRYGDDAIGDQVRAAKVVGRFDDGLVTTTAAFLRQRWNPATQPTWITSVPSRRQHELVGDFVQRLGAELNLPVVEVLTKVRDTPPQKTMSNSFFQCRNLDGVFELTSPPLPGRVLLVDDFVDSGWTFTILAMLLRQAGSGPVVPLALATTRPREA
jgi:ATP-dependent DNA helicase RecQ